MQISCSSQITQVTVFNRGALVQRQLVLPASALTAPASGEPASESSEILELVLSDVTPLAEPGSIRAAIAPGGRQIVLVQSALHVPSTPATRSESGLRVRELRQQVALRRSQQARLTEQREQLLQLMPDPALRTTSFVEKVDERIADALATAELLQLLRVARGHVHHLPTHRTRPLRIQPTSTRTARGLALSA